MTTRRYKLTVAYDGSAFHGWQKQQPPDQEWPRTVQGELEAAMMQVLRQPPEVFDLLGASRTDTGVHAVGQVCHFSSDTTIPIERLCRAINSRLPKDIDVRHAEVVHDDFDAIRDATDKQYRYRIHHTRHRPLGLRHMVYHEWGEIDVTLMQDAAKRLIGTHDVEGFAAAAHGRTTTVRTIHDCHVEEHPLSYPLPVGEGGERSESGEGTERTPASGYQGDSESPHPNPLPEREGARKLNADLPDAAHVTSAGREIHVVISGNGFLYNMVRIVAGTLLDVGLGRMPPERIDEILATQNRQIAGPTLPPNGLCLEWVKYGGVGLTPRRQDAKTPRKAEEAGDGE